MLFKGQVTRAQEAEENYVIKRELAVVRQQCNTASESLEKAQDTIRELQQQKVNTTPQSVHKQLVATESTVPTQETTTGKTFSLMLNGVVCRKIFSQGMRSSSAFFS